MKQRVLFRCAMFAALIVALPAVAWSATNPSARAGAPRVAQQHNKSMEHLEKSEQRLRERIQALAGEPPGTKRDEAIHATRKALVDTQQALIDMPVPREYRTSSSNTSETEYAKAMDHLQQAEKRLHDSIHTMATESGERRNDAFIEANEAMIDADQAVAMLPAPVGSSRSAGSGAQPSSVFSRIDRDGDGVITPAEFAEYENEQRSARR